MDRASTITPISHSELPAELRARAAYARRRARTLIFYEVEPNLLAFADELDARAEEMLVPGNGTDDRRQPWLPVPALGDADNAIKLDGDNRPSTCEVDQSCWPR